MKPSHFDLAAWKWEEASFENIRLGLFQISCNGDNPILVRAFLSEFVQAGMDIARRQQGNPIAAATLYTTQALERELRAACFLRPATLAHACSIIQLVGTGQAGLTLARQKLIRMTAFLTEHQEHRDELPLQTAALLIDPLSTCVLYLRTAGHSTGLPVLHTSTRE